MRIKIIDPIKQFLAKQKRNKAKKRIFAKLYFKIYEM